MSDLKNDVNALPPRSEAKLPSALSEIGKEKFKKYGWPFFKAGIVLDDGSGKFLLTKQAKERCKGDNGKDEWVPTKNGKWDLPCGRLREWETFEKAASREGGEESGYDFDIEDACFIGFRADINNPYIIIMYHAVNPYDISLTDPPDPEEIAAVDWFTYDEILEMRKNGELRNAELIISAISNARSGVSIPQGAITVFKSKFSKKVV